MEDNIRCVFPFEVLFKQFSFLQGVVTNRKSASKFLLHKCILCSVLFERTDRQREARGQIYSVALFLQ